MAPPDSSRLLGGGLNTQQKRETDKGEGEREREDRIKIRKLKYDQKIIELSQAFIYSFNSFH